MPNRIVIARYQENVDWAENLRDEFSVLIYKKGGNEQPWDDTLPNVGREAHTYLTHICDYYSGGLRADTIFCQGNPFDHDPNFLARIKDPAIRTYGYHLSTDSEGGPLVDWCQLHAYCTVLGLDCVPTYKFVAGAQFRVTAAQIHSRPLEFYKAALALCSLKESNGQGGKGSPAPWIFERLWSTIFGIEL